MGCSTINCKGESQEDRIGQLEDGLKEQCAISDAQQNKITIQDKRISNLYDEFLKLKKEIVILTERSMDAKYKGRDK